jgi:hypothetical protein
VFFKSVFPDKLKHVSKQETDTVRVTIYSSFDINHGNWKSPNKMEVLFIGKIIELNGGLSGKPCLMAPDGLIQ